MPIPSFYEAFQDLRPLLTILHEIIVDGVDNAHRIEQIHDELVSNGHLFSSNVRAFVPKRFRLDVQDEPFELSVGFNISLTVLSRDYRVRVRKAPVDDLPEPGDSPGSKAFFNQATLQRPLPFTADELAEFMPSPDAINLIAAWGLNELRQFESYILACPAPTPDGQPQEWYWAEPIFDLTRTRMAPPDADLFDDVENVEPKDDEAEGQEGTGTDGL